MLRRLYWAIKRNVPGPKWWLTKLIKGTMAGMKVRNQAEDKDFEQRR